jgi:hypothetical protein
MVLVDANQGKGPIRLVKKETVQIIKPCNSCQSLPASYCDTSRRLYFADGSMLKSIAPSCETGKETNLGLKEEFDTMSNLVFISAVRTRYSESQRETLIYIGNSQGGIYIFSKNSKLVDYQSLLVTRNHSVSSIDYMEQNGLFILVASFNESNSLKLLISKVKRVKRFSYDVSGIMTPETDEEEQQVRMETPRIEGLLNSFVLLRNRNKAILCVSNGLTRRLYQLDFPTYFLED